MFEEDKDAPLSEEEAEQRSTNDPANSRGPARGRVLNADWGGDKIAFEFTDPATPRESMAQQTARTIILEEQQRKRDIKTHLEKQKELRLKLVKHLLADEELKKHLNAHEKKAILPNSVEGKAVAKAVHKLVLQQKISAGGKRLPKDQATLAVMIALSANTKDRVTQIRKAVLHECDQEVGKLSGWNIEDLKEKFKKEGLTLKDGRGGLQIFVTIGDDEVAICNVPKGSARYAPKDYDSGNDAKPHRQHVKVQRGYAKDELTTDATVSKELRRRKEYVEDANGVPTRRFVTRAISHFHMATMLGLKYDGKRGFFTDNPRETFRGQRARGNPDKFAGNAGPTTGPFDLKNAAVVDPTKWIGKATPTGGRYILPGVKVVDVVQVGSNTYNVIMQGGKDMEYAQLKGFTLKSDARHNSKMTLNERVSMQLRNGSGADQTMLSATAIQMPVAGREGSEKVIRGNKGERFDKSPESLAVLELDLARAKAENIPFVNVHSADSHQYKIAYNRYIELKLPDSVKKDGIDALWDDPIKRDALAELDEYIYSARKNREVTIDQVPNSIIRRVNFAPAKARFPDFPLAGQGWLDWSDKIEEQCREYFSAERLDEAKEKADAVIKAKDEKKGGNTLR
jgi:hypothetical protein